MASRSRPSRQAGGGDRYGRERGAVHPGDRHPTERAPRLPADATVVRPDARLPRRGVARSEVVVRPRALVQRMESVLDLLDADLYIGIWRSYCEPACKQHRGRNHALSEEKF